MTILNLQNSDQSLQFFNMSFEDKQEYLRTEIVESGYDPQEFYQFWQNFNIELGDATLSDIQMVVAQFKEKVTQDNNKSLQKNNDEDDDAFGQYVEPTHNSQTSYYQDFNWDFLAPKKENTEKNVDDSFNFGSSPKKSDKKLIEESPPMSKGHKKLKREQIEELNENQKEKREQNLIEVADNLIKDVNNVTFQEVLKDSQSVKRKCLKLQPNLLDHHVNLQIMINKIEQISEENPSILNKIFKGSTQLFTVKTVGRNKQRAVGISWEVKRQYIDFQWLRNMLCKVYPGFVVPPLPAQIKSSNKLQGYLKKLQCFLMDCYNCPELRNSKYFEIFLSYSSQKDFQNFKKNSESASRPLNLTHILNMEGQIKLMYSDKIEDYAGGLQNFLTKSSQHLKNVKSIIQQIQDLYSNISFKYENLCNVFMTMSSQSCEFSDEECYPRLTETYKQISNLIKQHSEFCLNEKEFIETFMYSHFAYERDRIDNIQNLITKRKSFSTELLKPKHQIQSTQAQSNEKGGSVFSKFVGLFGEKSESMEIPSSETQTLKDQVGFYNSQLMKESIRCIEVMISSHVNHFFMYGHTRIDNMDSMQKIWSQVLVELSKLKTR